MSRKTKKALLSAGAYLGLFLIGYIFGPDVMDWMRG